jgi:hypothetical protein
MQTTTVPQYMGSRIIKISLWLRSVNAQTSDSPIRIAKLVRVIVNIYKVGGR